MSAMPNSCPECARSWGPNYIGPCDHGLAIRLPKRKAIRYATDEQILDAARRILERRYIIKHEVLREPYKVREYLQTWIGTERNEHFGLMFLDNQHRVIATEIISSGTIDGASVYPRTVIQAAMKHNAAAVIAFHNHPSGVAEPSSADRVLTERLKNALSQVDIRVLDHFVVGEQVVSFAERGWI